MSMKVLRALVGADEFAKLDDAEIRRLCDAIDAEILKDQSMTQHLLAVVRRAADDLSQGAN
jgi:hypothetical protein